MHPKVEIYLAWINELKLEFKDFDDKSEDWMKITRDIEEFQNKVDMQAKNIKFLAQNTNNVQYYPLLQKGVVLMQGATSLSENMTSFYNRYNELQNIQIKMTNNITESSKDFDPYHPEILINRNRTILNAAKDLTHPIEKDLNNRLIALQEERKALEKVLNDMIE